MSMAQPMALGTFDAPCGRHASAAEYTAFVRARYGPARSLAYFLGLRDRFVRVYPDLGQRFSAPLAERVGRLHGSTRTCLAGRVSYKARPYLWFLALHGYARFDWAWLIPLARLYIWELLAGTSLHAAAAELVEDAVRLGYDRPSAAQGLRWAISRIFLHTGDPRAECITDAGRVALVAAVERFGQRQDLALFYGSTERYREAAKGYLTGLHLLQVVLYHRGQTALEPRKTHRPGPPRPALQPHMEATLVRYLAARRVTDRPATVVRLEQSLRQFMAWLATAYPTLESFADVTRDHVVAFAAALDTLPIARTGRPYATLTKRGRLSGLSTFFRDTAAWGWTDVPGRPLLGVGDLPKIPQRVPRYIPDDELARLMVAIRALPCPYQRAALLAARWSGARRDEIRRLEVDCLDRYPDGTPRLRLPAGKMKRERLVPLHEEAAAAIRQIQTDRRGERGFVDTQTGVETRYLFMHHGKVFSPHYLFMAPLRAACRAAGLVTPDGRPTVSAHRFRHTVGHQLAEKGAKLRTIMTVLGHTSASMSLVYAQISDREVLKDYQTVLAPGAIIAGPYAQTLHAGALSPTAVDWLQANFFKTELELGHCLRLPQEGPCECDLYLTCAKFVTTPAYAPRLRARRRRESALIAEAASNGWEREVERHRGTVQRIEQLLTELGEPLTGQEDDA